jgi:hypothetical protein
MSRDNGMAPASPLEASGYISEISAIAISQRRVSITDRRAVARAVAEAAGLEFIDTSVSPGIPLLRVGEGITPCPSSLHRSVMLTRDPDEIPKWLRVMTLAQDDRLTRGRIYEITGWSPGGLPQVNANDGKTMTLECTDWEPTGEPALVDGPEVTEFPAGPV